MKIAKRDMGYAKAGCLVFACMASAIHAGTWPAGTTTSSDVAFGSSSARLASDTVTIPNEGVEAGTLAVWSATNAVIGFEGGGITFGSSASITLGDGEADFNVPITSAGGLSLMQESSGWSFSGVEVYSGETVTVIANADIDALYPTTAHGSRSNVGSDTFAAFNVRRGTGWLEVQYQYLVGNFLKAIKVRYEQSGTGITAKILYAKYYKVDETGIAIGADLDSSEWSDKGAFYKTGRNDSNSTGINTAEFCRIVPAAVRFQKPVTLAGAGVLSIGKSVQAILGEGATEPIETFSAPLTILGDLTYEVATNQTFTSTVNGGGSLVRGSLTFVGATNALPQELDSQYSFEPESWFPSDWTIVFTNALLSSITNITDGKMGGYSLGGNTGDEPWDAQVLFFRNDGVRASFQLQRKDSSLCRAVLVEMRQCEEGIELRSPRVGYVSAELIPSGDEGYDFVTHGWIAGQNGTPSRGYYNAKSATFHFSKAMRPIVVSGTITTTASSGFSCGTVNVRSTENTAAFLTIANQNFAPGSIHVDGGAVVMTLIPGQLQLGNEATFTLHPGSTYIASKQSISKNSLHTIDAATLLMGAGLAKDYRGKATYSTYDPYAIGVDGQAYLNKAVLRNGARIAGAGIRCGHGANSSLWRIEGETPSFVDNDIYLFAKSASDLATITNDVADVTGDSSPDFFVGGGFKRFEGFLNAQYVKAGLGTLRVGGVCTFTNLTDVAEGTMLYSANALSGAEQFRLSGGALAFEDGTTNAVHTLGVSAAGGALNVGTNAAFSVVNNASIEGPLEVTLGDGATFRVGTTACLTPEARAQIRVNGFKMVQNEQGYVIARRPRGITMSFK